MDNLGIKVMLNMLFGNEESVKAFMNAKGKKIAKVEMVEGIKNKWDGEHTELVFTMDDGYKMALWDDGQSCCESRYMTTDDDLNRFIGAELLGAEIRDGDEPPKEDYDNCDVHEVQFLIVHTSLGDITCVTHNEHNGYYGGFSVVCTAREER